MDTTNIFAAYEDTDSKTPDSLLDKAIEACENDQSIITQIINEINSDTEDDSIKLLSRYKMASDHEKAVIDFTLVYLTGWTLKTLIKKMLNIYDEN